MERFESIPKLLSVLAHDGNYSYIDRLGYTHAKGLTIYCLKEALRAFHALKRSPPSEMPDEAKRLLMDLSHEEIDREIMALEKISDTVMLREKVSLICARALALSVGYVKAKEERGA